MIDGRITGKVIDGNNNSPLEYATISLFRQDSSIITGAITSDDGSFSINIGPGNYFAEIQFISYEKKVIQNIVVTPRNRFVDIGTVALSPQATALDEVTVTGERSEMVINLDKKIFNVGKDLSNTGKTALDILDNIPSVTVDLEGNISLRGSQNLQILIDGKPSGLVNSSNTDALQTLQGSMIERIEIITNPSARYEAEGMAGIINIVLRKDANKGVHGTFEATIGYPQQYSLGVNFNFRREKINYFLNYNVRYNERPGSGNSFQNFTLPDSSYTTLIDRERLRTGLSNRIRGGVDFFINPKNTITTSFLFSVNDQSNTSRIRYSDYTSAEPISLLANSDRTDKQHEDENDIELSLNYEKRFEKKDHKLIFLAQYMENSETQKSTIKEEIDPFGENNDKVLFQRAFNVESEKNILLQADYNYPFGNKGLFEAGYRSEFRNISNPYNVEQQNDDNTWMKLPEYSNQFEYIENIHAVYVQGGNNFNKISLQFGLRSELSDVHTYLHETAEKNENLYIDFFPTFHSSYQFNKIHSAQFSYSRRIQRPRFWDLNPFFSYSDSRNIRSGNPNLKPEYTHSLETGYLADMSTLNFYSGIYYRYTTNVYERVSFVNDSTGITQMMPLNLSERHSFGAESNITLRMQKWWTLTASVNLFRFITDGHFGDEHLHSDDFSWNTRLNGRLRLPESIDIQTIFFYRAPQETTEGIRKAFYMLNMGISKDVLNGNGTFTFNINDVLNSRKFRYVIDQPDLYAENEFRWSKRSYTFTFIYRLNQNKRNGRDERSNEGSNDMGGEDMGF
jgi:outer membrane receptor protein involved in Fe transport